MNNDAFGPWRPQLAAACLCAAALLPPVLSSAGPPMPVNGGPYDLWLLAGGTGIVRTLGTPARPTSLADGVQLSAWVQLDLPQPGIAALLALGDPRTGLRLVLEDDVPVLQLAGRPLARAPAPLLRGQWTHVAGTCARGVATLYVAGRAVASGAAPANELAPTVALAEPVAGEAHFGGALARALVGPGAQAAADVAAIAAAPPRFELLHFWHVGAGWEFQRTANTGYWRPQDPWTLPTGRGDGHAPVATPPTAQPVLEPLAAGRWALHGWRLAAAPDVAAPAPTLARAGFDDSAWLQATVPGTVLATLVDRGVYPDPYYGLDNLRIPEQLARQDYWYRTRFTRPVGAPGTRYTVMFGGVNYAAEAWFNGERIGTTTGAFIRGQFELRPVAGENVLAVRVSPPPHPGTAHEQSISAGVGENGGQLAIDGPTFVATEGWDWIPGIRDRDTGLWQGVELHAHGDLVLGDPRVVTDLPLPRTDSADVYVEVPVDNRSDAPRQASVSIAFDDVHAEQAATLPPGESTVRFSPTTHPVLHLENPRLWWPNGYGEQALHALVVRAGDAAGTSDERRLRFGIREVSYDLSLFDGAGRLRRVNVQPTEGRLAGTRLIDVRHEAIKKAPRGWAESLTAAGERSPAVRDIDERLPEPHLALRVNGVRIAARGGSWGMDDAMKRSDRAHLEPYFRLHREAHLNIIRNWMGNNDEDAFYDLADEYGLMVLNDFWQSTQNFQIEPQDPQLFLANARDVVARYRNHPSIVAWFGRNEGVPYPVLNEGLDDALFALDGTRWYTGSSNEINLQGSGPYDYRPPEGYFADLATGFSVEVGTASLASPGAVRASVPEADLWPLSDTLAYHDWHFSGNGDTHSFMAALERMYGAPTGFDDFERKAQMMNLETHQAIFEGFLGHLWERNSGRLLWMTHPSWPSNAWQVYSSDYDTAAAYYGTKRANQPLHLQLDRPDDALVVVNTTRNDQHGLRAEVEVTGLDGRSLYRVALPVDAPANQARALATVPLATLHAGQPMLLVWLRLLDARGSVLARNGYWRGVDDAAYRALGRMPAARLDARVAALAPAGAERAWRVTVRNRATVPALNVQLSLQDGAGQRLLPAYYEDNYFALRPGEAREVLVRSPAGGDGRAQFALQGWNVPATVAR